jgi:hypothetical protein
MLIFLRMFIYYSLHDDATQTFVQLNTRFYLGLGFPSNPPQNSLLEVSLGAINKKTSSDNVPCMINLVQVFEIQEFDHKKQSST